MNLRNISAQTLSRLAFAGIALILSANTLRPDISGRLRKDYHIGKKAVPAKPDESIPLTKPQ